MTRDRTAGFWRRAGRGVALCSVLALATGLPRVAGARAQKTVFHGMPIEPETGIKPGQARETIALSAAWTFSRFEAPLAGEPAAAGDRLVAADRAGVVVALRSADGGEAWRVRLEVPLAVGPMVFDGIVYQGSVSGRLYALRLEDGREIWRADVGGAPQTPPIAVHGRLLLATDLPELIAVDPAKGGVRQRLPLPGRPGPPTLDGAVLVVGTEHGMVLALDALSLRVLWRRYVRHAVTAPPFLYCKRVYVAVADRTLRCLRLASGRPLWRQRTGSTVTARLVARDDLLYAPCFDNDIYVLQRRSGHLLGRVRLDHRLSQDATVLGHHLFITPFTEGAVVGLELPGLQVAGRFHLEAPGQWFTSPPVVSGARVAVGWGRDAGRITALDVAAGPPADAAKPAGRRPAPTH